MADICRAFATGRLVRDAELKFTSGGIPCVRFSIAVNKRRKINGQYTDVGQFFDCIYWGAVAEGIVKYLVKGKEVAVDGELNQNRWEQDGETRSKIEIQVENIKLGHSPQGNASGRRQPEGPPQQSQNQYAEGSYPYPQEVPDDIPF